MKAAIKMEEKKKAISSLLPCEKVASSKKIFSQLCLHRQLKALKLFYFLLLQVTGSQEKILSFALRFFCV